jgi:hypothetical protein
MGDDPRQAAERYRLERDARAGRLTPEDAAALDQEKAAPARGSTAAERAAFVENSIQQAIRRGDFDNLPGAGRPLPDLGASHDPDWWIRRKIETEKLTGLGPPALTLRVEHAEMAERLDALHRADDVRDAVEDFNRRVIEARRQLLGGPPVVTPTLGVEEQVAAWEQRRAARLAAAASAAPPAPRGRRSALRRLIRRRAAPPDEPR